MKQAALRVVKTLQDAGFVALFAGGCVRDLLMGHEPHDYDVATSARPEEVLPLFRRTRTVGAKFGVVLVQIGRYAIEVATFRTDGSYADGRRPDAVQFTDAREDARRRDFTINGMFCDPVKDEIVDHVGGRADLAAGLIRAIGEPEARFREDHLRLLRAVRFAARFGFTIEPDTWSALCRHAAEIATISPERIRVELEGMLEDRNRATAVSLLHRSGLLRHLWPGAEAVESHMASLEATLGALSEAARFEVGLAVLLSVLSPKQVAAACSDLRCSNASTETVRWLVRHQDALRDPAGLTQADLKLLMAHAAFGDLMDWFAARTTALGDARDAYEEIAGRVSRIPAAEVAPPPLLTGHDLSALGLPSGPRYKEILDRVYYAQLNGEIREREAALEMARRLMDRRD